MVNAEIPHDHCQQQHVAYQRVNNTEVEVAVSLQLLATSVRRIEQEDIRDRCQCDWWYGIGWV